MRLQGTRVLGEKHVLFFMFWAPTCSLLKALNLLVFFPGYWGKRQYKSTCRKKKEKKRKKLLYFPGLDCGELGTFSQLGF